MEYRNLKNRTVQRRLRRGFSLLEVIISIGIVAVGLLGAIAIVPFGNELISQGLTEDRKAVAGKNWVAEFHTRGMARPENWMFPNNTPYYNYVTRQNQRLQYPINRPFPPRQALLIDPRYVAVHRTNRPRFPYLTGSPPPFISMQRLTLRAGPGGGRMGIPQAEEIFRSHDDLVYQQGNNDFDPPKQEYIVRNGVRIKRQADGRISWMAMLAPKVGAAGRAVSDFYTLSVIVFEDRNLQIPDRLAKVAIPSDFYSGGVGGGDLKITATQNANDINVRTGDWVMLAGFVTDNTFNPPRLTNVFKWYRITGTDLIDTTTTATPSRNITLQGPDWDYRKMSTPQVVIVPNVVAVFEKTIRLETSSLWSN